MNHLKSLICLTLLVAACKPASKPQEQTSAPVAQQCPYPGTAKVIAMAREMISKKDKRVWNLSGIDSIVLFEKEGYFTSKDTMVKLVLLNGEAGLSSGNADNLMMILSCDGKVLWLEQTGELDTSLLRDLNGDGIWEIVVNTGSTWMGECHDVYSIFSLARGEKNVLYDAYTHSAIGCGMEDPEKHFSKGDTIELLCESMLDKKGDKYIVRQIRTAKVHAGGKNFSEVLSHLKVARDTSFIEL